MKNKEPLISIIIPTYNREKIIKETIDCALNQTFNDYEIVIVDNKSTDSTYDILQEYANKNPKIKIFQNEENIGPVRNWNECLKKSKGKYIKILWSDDQISSDFLEKTITFLKENDDISFVYTKTLIYGENINKEVYNLGASGKYKIIDFIEGIALGIKEIPVSPGCAIFRREDLEKNLLINLENPKKLDFSKYGAGNDLLLFLLCYPKYKYFYYIDEVKSYFRAHKDSFSIANNLVEYYNYSIVYFLENNKNLIELEEIKNKFYTKLYFQNKYMIQDKKYRFVYRFLIEKIMKKLFKKRG